MKLAFIVALTADRRSAQVVTKTALPFADAVDQFKTLVDKGDPVVDGLPRLEVWTSSGVRKNHKFKVAEGIEDPVGELSPDDGLDGLTVPDLRELAVENGVAIPSSAKRDEVIALLRSSEVEVSPDADPEADPDADPEDDPEADPDADPDADPK